MKIALESVRTVDWDTIDIDRTKAEVDKYFSEEIYKREMEPFVVRELHCGKNRLGQFLIEMHLKNHKYVNIENPSWLSWDAAEIEGEQPAEYGSRGFFITSRTEVILPDSDYPVPLWRTELVVTPETESESLLVGGHVSILPLKWGYDILFLPFSHYDMSDQYNDGTGDGDDLTIAPDTVYRYD